MALHSELICTTKITAPYHTFDEITIFVYYCVCRYLYIFVTTVQPNVLLNKFKTWSLFYVTYLLYVMSFEKGVHKNPTSPEFMLQTADEAGCCSGVRCCALVIA